MRLKESGEMYLETIYVLTKENKSVRSVDIGEYMGFSKPSVSRAMGLLKSDGYIVVDKSGYISLTNKGKDVAQKIYERHTFLTKVLTKLGVDETVAVSDACKIEHDISDETFKALKKYFSNKTE
ncbi:MAG: metal-dependent transcriptional regulator [Clostridia bacterium]|nr:metal-dependent transcriptional regulator [Clostridia bacterium]